MKSRLADQIRDEQAADVLAMTPAERVAAALELGERAVEDYVANFGVTREEAVRALRRASQEGRRYSRCFDFDRPDSDGR